MKSRFSSCRKSRKIIYAKAENWPVLNSDISWQSIAAINCSPSGFSLVKLQRTENEKKNIEVVLNYSKYRSSQFDDFLLLKLAE